MEMLRYITQFFELMVNFSSIGAASINLTENTEKRSIKGNCISFKETGIKVTISRWQWQIAKSLNKSQEILLSIPLKIERLDGVTEFKNQETLSPLLSINLSKRFDVIDNALKAKNSITLSISYDEEIVLNEAILKSQFFGLKDSFFKVEKEGKLYELTFGDLIPEKQRGTEEAFYSLMSYFKPIDTPFFKLSTPTGKKDDMLMTLFSEVKNIKIKRNLQEIGINPNKLVKEYLFAPKENETHEFVSPMGHYQKSFKMSSGQFQGIVLLSHVIYNRIKQTIITIFGPAGTGKSAYIHSAMESIIIANVELLLDGKLIKPSAVVSTAYKAVTGLLKDYSTFIKGLTITGGNATQKKISKKENDDVIQEITNATHNPVKMAKVIKEIKILKEKQIKRNNLFADVKESKIFVDFKNMKKDLEIQLALLSDMIIDEEKLVVYREAIYSILKMSNINTDSLSEEQAMEKTLEILKLNSIKIKLAAEDLPNPNEKNIVDLMSEFFAKTLVELETGEENITKISKQKDVRILFYYLTTIDKEDFKATMSAQDNTLKIKTIKSLLFMCINNKGIKLVEDMITIKTIEDFSQEHFDISNAIGFKSKIVLRELVYKNKEDVLKAIGFFSTTKNSIQYIQDNYGHTKKMHQKFLSDLAMVYPFIGTSLASVSNLFYGLNDALTPFNFTIADEAGMITSIDMLQALRLSDKAIIVGDTQQLQPIFTIDDMFSASIRTLVDNEPIWKKYSPLEVSAFHLASGLDSKEEEGCGRGILLNEHRRCAVPIAKLAQSIIYQYKDLEIKTQKIRNSDESNDLDLYEKIGSHLMFLNVKKTISSGRNENMDEVYKIEKLLKRLDEIGFDITKDVGIITPYANQASLLTKKFATMLGQVEGAEPRIGTVHKFQGAEYKIIILSTVVSEDDDSLNFINEGPYLVNVAVTRAKNHLILVGDYEKLISDKNEKNYIGKISTIIKSTGTFK